MPCSSRLPAALSPAGWGERSRARVAPGFLLHRRGAPAYAPTPGSSGDSLLVAPSSLACLPCGARLGGRGRDLRLLLGMRDVVSLCEGETLRVVLGHAEGRLTAAGTRTRHALGTLLMGQGPIRGDRGRPAPGPRESFRANKCGRRARRRSRRRYESSRSEQSRKCTKGMLVLLQASSRAT
mgnify:CR=1 FL=1